MLKNKSIKTILFAVFITAILFFITGCNRNRDTAGETASPSVIQISETMFITHVNDIYANSNRNIGRTIRLQGIFLREPWDEPFSVVFRNAPGCCGNDGIVGFYTRWPEHNRQPYPEDNAWVEVTGVLRSYQHGTNNLLFIELASLVELSTRGQEFVTR
ncbi:MAG: hypothetical protein FWC97_08490 [Treponema sp.]|nr:hypothetical protein [Treponema sp.]